VSGAPVLALDLGTTSVRALVLRDGEVVGRADSVLTTRYPGPGRVEQAPEEMLESGVAVMREALETAGIAAGEIAGLGIVSQRSTAIAWDARSGEPLAPAIGWQDRRNLSRVEALSRGGMPISTLASATKFEWLLEHVPAVRAAAEARRLRLGNPDAWLGDRLSGGAVFATDAGHASCTGLYVNRKAAWSPRALAFFGLEPGWLPELVPTSGVVGALDPRWLGAAIPLAARAGDQQAACYGQGVREPGQAKLTLGTSAMLNVHVGEDTRAAAPGCHLLPLWELPDGERAFCLEGTVITAASTLDWCVEIGLLGSAEELEYVLEQEPGTGGVSFVPALQGLGTPLMDGDARALVVGLTRGSTAHQLVRAAAEGVAHRCVDMCDVLGLGREPLSVDGGLARCDAFLQILADLLGRPVVRSHETETTAIGAALLAGLAVGSAFPSTSGASERLEPQRDPAWREASRAHWRRALERAQSEPSIVGS